jgi:hypothetical protein
MWCSISSDFLFSIVRLSSCPVSFILPRFLKYHLYSNKLHTNFLRSFLDWWFSNNNKQELFVFNVAESKGKVFDQKYTFLNTLPESDQKIIIIESMSYHRHCDNYKQSYIICLRVKPFIWFYSVQSFQTSPWL